MRIEFIYHIILKEAYKRPDFYIDIKDYSLFNYDYYILQNFAQPADCAVAYVITCMLQDYTTRYPVESYLYEIIVKNWHKIVEL